MISPPKGLKFIERDHRYVVDGVELPSVTRILDAAGFIDHRWHTEAVMMRGKRVAIATALDDGNQLDESRLSPDEMARVVAWRTFRAHTSCRIHAVEHRVWGPNRQYAGTIDRVATLLACNDGRGITIIDMKAGVPEPWHVLQLVAYIEAYRASHPDNLQLPLHAINVYLELSGSFKMVEHDGAAIAHATNVFFGALVCFDWKTRNMK